MTAPSALSYAERYGAYPTVVATGGDAGAIFGTDELIDRIVPDLLLNPYSNWLSRSIIGPRGNTTN